MSRFNSSNTYVCRGSDQYRKINNALNSLNSSRKSKLEKILLELYNNHRITENERVEFQETFDEISNFIKQYFPNVIVCLYGSHINGLANKNSDLDITILFLDGKNFSNLSRSRQILKLGLLYSFLCLSPNYLVVRFIKAKIPIVKFKTTNGVNVDISIDNFHALQNSHLLKAYSDLDSRVIVLGQLLKHVVKLYTDGDAYKDMLTSYGYILMLIHYLQTKKVLPVLHEDIDYDVDPEIFKCNKMYSNKKMIKASRNCKKLGITDLWIGFFKYYTMEFKIKKHVVSIRHSTCVSKLIKSRILYLSMKDPIDSYRDLAIHLNSKNVEKILDSFIDVLLRSCGIDPMMTGFSKYKVAEETNYQSEESSETDESGQSESEDESDEFFESDDKIDNGNENYS